MKAKYKLKADFVDRIAICDKPCVPDAQIVLFKRKEDDAEILDKSEESAITEIEKSIEILTKAGRKISGARIKKLKDALGILTGLINEVVDSEATAMTMTPEHMARVTDAMLGAEPIKKQMEDVKKLQESVDSITKVIGENAESSKKLKEEILKSVLPKSEILKEMNDELNKRFKEREEISQQILKKAEDAKKLETESFTKHKADMGKQLTGIEELLEKHKKCILDLNSKYGIKKTSLDEDMELSKGEIDSNGEAKFNDVVRGKKRA
jgi:ElaB/YqjD/DUF883 family membrane-anchored ribosome-binding protein